MPSNASPVPARHEPLGQRSATPEGRRVAADLGDPGSGHWPGVSYVMPVLNEERDLREAVGAVLNQDYPGQAEIVLALGPSHDATDAIAAELAAADSRIRLVHNPRPNISASLNLAIRATEHPVIVRVDAHSTLCQGYTRQAVTTLRSTGAANVGGIMDARGRSTLQRAIAVAYNSPVGLGGVSYHGQGEAGEAESAYLGVFRRQALLAVGLFDEDLQRGEDWELNLRLRQAGHLVLFDPQLRVTYWPRASWGALARQFNATGTWRGELVRRHGSSNSLRYFAPPALVAGAGAAAVAGLVRATSRLPRRVNRLLELAQAPVVAYAGLLGVTGARATRPEDGATEEGRVKALVPPVLALMHVAWGTGFLRGVLHGGEGTVDTSRIRHRPRPTTAEPDAD